MPTPQFTEWHTAEHLENEEDIRLYLDACKAYDDPRLMSFAQREAAKARENFSKRVGCRHPVVYSVSGLV